MSNRIALLVCPTAIILTTLKTINDQILCQKCSIQSPPCYPQILFTRAITSTSITKHIIKKMIIKIPQLSFFHITATIIMELLHKLSPEQLKALSPECLQLLINSNNMNDDVSKLKCYFDTLAYSKICSDITASYNETNARIAPEILFKYPILFNI